eukprot:COSAG05_NODE_504_length_9208_cov_22.420024_10_plen_113_part_00
MCTTLCLWRYRLDCRRCINTSLYTRHGRIETLEAQLVADRQAAEEAAAEQSAMLLELAEEKQRHAESLVEARQRQAEAEAALDTLQVTPPPSNQLHPHRRLKCASFVIHECI